jgi:CheY-specific phosphatase CheX
MALKDKKDNTLITTDDIFKILCGSIQSTLASATNSPITFSPMVQKIEKTCLKPDIGCFVLFGGDFSGLVVMNFSAEAAMEIYRRYLLGMGMPEDELAGSHTADEVANSLGELMNQCIGRFRVDLEKDTTIFVNQSQPKMMVVNEAVEIAIEAGIDRPQLRKISFKTGNSQRFYLEVSLGQISFYPLFPFSKGEEIDIEEIMEATASQKGKKRTDDISMSQPVSNGDLDALMSRIQK